MVLEKPLEFIPPLFLTNYWTHRGEQKTAMMEKACSNLRYRNLKMCEKYLGVINIRVKLACASHLISVSKIDTMTFVFEDYRTSFRLNYALNISN